jgi:predicted HicB family RNase H-like nuclease
VKLILKRASFLAVLVGFAIVVTFQGDNVTEAKQAFYDSVDDYLEFCQERGKEPDRPLVEAVAEPA